MWAPEDGRGAMGGPWAAKPAGGVGSAARVMGVQSPWFKTSSLEDDEALKGLELELFYEDDLDGGIASY